MAENPAGAIVDILMFHSVAEARGATSRPTSVAPGVFAAQMQALARSGLPVISLGQLAAARGGGPALPPRSVILTFDDGFRDFADAAWPLLRDRGWPVCVYLPTGPVGGHETWRGRANPPRPLMGWDVIARLAGEGVTFGAHSVNHPDLLALDPAARLAELRQSRDAIAARLGRVPAHFAPPYGRSDAALRETLAGLFDTSCGTRLGQARLGQAGLGQAGLGQPGAASDLHDLPRLEMFYFTDLARWQAHLAGRGAGYLALRRGLRGLRGLVRDPWGRARNP